jgi:predicted membrane-bound mannosyltransferase
MTSGFKKKISTETEADGWTLSSVFRLFAPQSIFRTMQSLKPLHWLVVIAVLVGAFFRIYNSSETVQFLGDQGRDALIVSRMFKELDPVFIGPVTSVGNMYLGPLYYYFMLPFLMLSYPSPMGPVWAVIGLSIVTIFLMYCWGSKMIGERGAVVAAWLIAFSATIVEYSRFSWNPNPTPLVMLAMVYATFLAVRKNVWYWVVVFGLFGILIQLHYLTLITAGGAGVVWLLTAWEKRNDRRALSKLGLATGAGIAVVVLLMLPLILFDIRYDFLNAQAFLKLFTTEEAFTESVSFAERFRSLGTLFVERSEYLLVSVLFGTAGSDGLARSSGIAVLLTLLAVVGYVWKKSAQKTRQVVSIILAYFGVSILGISVYRHAVYDHYILFLIPLVVMLYAVLAEWLLKKHTLFWIPISMLLMYTAVVNVPRMPLIAGGMTISQYAQSSEEISELLRPGEEYNIVLLSVTGDLYGQNYRYFLSTYEDKEPIDPERQVEVDTLVIINEEQLENILELPIYQIQIFPDKTNPVTHTLSTGLEVTLLRDAE